MTIEERKRLVTQNFDTLWKNLWGDHIGIQYRGEEKTSRDKMLRLKNGITINNEKYDLFSKFILIDFFFATFNIFNDISSPSPSFISFLFLQESG